jgi:hypothetical protein
METEYSMAGRWMFFPLFASLYLTSRSISSVLHGLSLWDMFPIILCAICWVAVFFAYRMAPGMKWTERTEVAFAMILGGLGSLSLWYNTDYGIVSLILSTLFFIIFVTGVVLLIRNYADRKKAKNAAV